MSLLLLLASPALATDEKLVTVTNGTTSTAAGFKMVFTGAAGDINISPYTVIAPTACGLPTIPSNAMATSTAVVVWVSACIPPGATVTFVATTTSGVSLGYVAGLTSYWMSSTGASLGLLGAVTISSMLPAVPPPPAPPVPAPPPAPPVSIPITATVVSPVTGITSIATIGTLTAGASVACDPALAAASGMEASFSLLPAYTWLDGAHDFKFVQVAAAYVVGGDHAGTSFPMANFPAFPAVDPAPCTPTFGCVPPDYPVADTSPYYVGDSYWTSPTGPPAHAECVFSSMGDCPELTGDGTPSDEVAVYFTFVVVDDGDGAALGPTEFCVLGGFAWYYNDAFSDVFGSTGHAAVIGPVAPNPALIAAALALAATPVPPATPFSSWTPVTGTPLGAANEGMGCFNFPPPIALPSLWASCAPKLGTTFTLNAKLVSPSVVDCPSLPCYLGGPVYYAVGASLLPSPVDLATFGIAPSGTCFLYVLPSMILASATAVAPGGLWSESFLLPTTPTLEGLTFYVQLYQVVTGGPLAPPPFGSYFAMTPYVAETILAP